jgi:outer membrane PBP1 activator LpoA protein
MMRKKGTRTLYRIVVRSELGDRYASAFEGMHIKTKVGDTILTAEIVDQPQLHGILDRIRSLGLELLSVQALPEEAPRVLKEIESQSHELGARRQLEQFSKRMVPLVETRRVLSLLY